MFKILLATFALLAVASATDVYSAVFTSTNDCTGGGESFKDTLDQCSNAGGSPTNYRKITLDGTTYSTGWYSDSTCSTTLSTISANPYTGAAGACTAYTASSAAKSVQILSGSDYASGSAANYDCTSGQCVEVTNDPTTAPTSAPTNDGTIVTIFSNGDCSSTPLICYLVKMDQCTVTSGMANADGTDFAPDGTKLTLSGSTYSYSVYMASGSDSCAVLAEPPVSDSGETCAAPNPITGAANDCTAFALSYGSAGAASVPYSMKVMSSSDYVTATYTYDCTSDDKTCATVTVSNSAAHVSIGILSACLAVMAQWIA